MKASWGMVKKKLRNTNCSICKERVDLEIPFIVCFGKKLELEVLDRKGRLRHPYEPTRLYHLECFSKMGE